MALERLAGASQTTQRNYLEDDVGLPPPPVHKGHGHVHALCRLSRPPRKNRSEGGETEDDEGSGRRPTAMVQAGNRGDSD